MQAGAENGDRRTFRVERGTMSRGIDARRKPAHDASTGSNERRGKFARDAHTVRGRAPSTHDGDARLRGQDFSRAAHP